VFTNVLEKHVAFILKLEEAAECGKSDIDIWRGHIDSVALSEPIGVRTMLKGCEVLKKVIFKEQKAEIYVPLENAHCLQSKEVDIPSSCLSHHISLFHMLEKYVWSTKLGMNAQT
jgi:hypothetical protein